MSLHPNQRHSSNKTCEQNVICWEVCSGCPSEVVCCWWRVCVQRRRRRVEVCGPRRLGERSRPLWLVRMLLLITEQKGNWKCICFKNVDFPPSNPLSLSLSVARVILYWLRVWQKTKKSWKEALQGREGVKFLLKVFLHLCICIIWSRVSWLREAETGFDWWGVIVALLLLAPKDVFKSDWLKYFLLT